MNTEEFEIISTLQKSEKSETLLVRDPISKSIRVKKIFDGEPSCYERLMSLKHANLPRVISCEQAELKTVLIEEYIAGPDLAEFLLKNGKLGEKEAVSVLLQLCDVLSLLHKNGIIHRDIKPSNIILAEGNIVKLIDFDAARIVKDSGDRDTRALGTRGYASPEQYGFSQTDKRTDIYALGVTAIELLGGDDYRGKYRNVLDKCMEIDPKRRYKGCEQLRKALLRARHPYNRLLYRAAIVFAAIVAICGGIYATNGIIDNLASARRLGTEDVNILYAVYESKENAIGHYLSDGEGELVFDWDSETLDGTPDFSLLNPDARYIAYTVPRSSVVICLQNNGKSTLRNVKVALRFTDVIVWEGGNNAEFFSYEGFYNGVGGYSDIIWKSDSDIHAGDEVWFRVYLSESVVESDDAAVEFVITADNYDGRRFTLPVRLDNAMLDW
jgi:serine/threonine protein kinase